MPMVTMAVDTVMVVMDMVATVESVPLNLTMAMDTDAVMDMVDTDMVDSHTLMVDTDTHTLMEVTTILARDLPNHLPTMDMAVVMDMAVTDMVDTVERDPLNHTTDTEDTDMAVMAMAMVVKSYFYKKLKAFII